MQNWWFLGVAIVAEVAATSALKASEGFTRLWPTVIFLVATVASVMGLGQAMRVIPTGTAYAVWTSVGTVLTVSYSVAIGAESMSWLKALFLAGIVACVIGLKQLDATSTAGSAVERKAKRGASTAGIGSKP